MNDISMILPEPVKPGHISFSSLKSFTTCHYMYVLEKLEKVPTAKSYALAGGSAVHHACDTYDFEVAKTQEVSF